MYCSDMDSGHPYDQALPEVQPAGSATETATCLAPVDRHSRVHTSDILPLGSVSLQSLTPFLNLSIHPTD